MVQTREVLEQARQGNFDLVSEWLEASSPDVNATIEWDDNGKVRKWTLLHCIAAAEAKNIVVLPYLTEKLLAKGANPHQGDGDDGISGDTPFNVAAPASPVVGRLMANHWLESALEGNGPKGLNDTSGSHDSTLAQYLAKWSHDNEITDQLKRGIGKKMAIATPNKDGWTPLHAAAAMGHVRAAEVFSSCYTDEEKKLCTAAPYAAPYGVMFPANATAMEIAQTRLKDPNLSAEMKRNLEGCITAIKFYGSINLREKDNNSGYEL